MIFLWDFSGISVGFHDISFWMSMVLLLDFYGIAMAFLLFL